MVWASIPQKGYMGPFAILIFGEVLRHSIGESGGSF